MVANKIPGVRAALAYDLSSARNSREHNDANVLTLGAGLIGASLAQQIVERPGWRPNARNHATGIASRCLRIRGRPCSQEPRPAGTRSPRCIYPIRILIG
jgi:hypothetical protein